MVNKTPFFSIVIPVYNAEKTLAACIASITEQKNNSCGYELILINDGSTDSSLKVCRAFEQKHPQIRVYSQVNKGASAARNVGIQSATGRYICFVDSDDTVTDNYMQVLENSAKINQSDVIVLGINTLTDNISTQHLPKPAETIYLAKDILRFLEEVQNSYPYSKIYKTSFLRENKLLFSEELVLWEDLDFTFRALSVCQNYSAISLPLYHYHLYASEESITRSGHTRAYRDSLVFLKHMDACIQTLHWEHSPEMQNYRLHLRRSMAYGHFSYLLMLPHDSNPEQRNFAFTELMQTKQLREDVLFGLRKEQHSLVAIVYKGFLTLRLARIMNFFVYIKNKWIFRKGERYDGLF